MKSNAQRQVPIDEDVAQRQKTGSGAYYPQETDSTRVDAMMPEGNARQTEFPDLGESTKAPVKPPESQLVRCPRCGMAQVGWTANEGAGYSDQRGDKYCCEGCAIGLGCSCIGEPERHTGENIGQDRG